MEAKLEGGKIADVRHRYTNADQAPRRQADADTGDVQSVIHQGAAPAQKRATESAGRKPASDRVNRRVPADRRKQRDAQSKAAAAGAVPAGAQGPTEPTDTLPTAPLITQYKGKPVKEVEPKKPLGDRD